MRFYLLYLISTLLLLQVTTSTFSAFVSNNVGCVYEGGSAAARYYLKVL